METKFAAIARVGIDVIQRDAASATFAEHICLESDESIVTAPTRVIRRGPSVIFSSRLHGCETELALCQDDRLAVRSRSRRQPLQAYVVDLRFVDSKLIVKHRIAWRSWLACCCLAAMIAASQSGTAGFADPAWLQLSGKTSIVMLILAVCSGMLALYFTRETIELRSMHGRTRLVEITCGLGDSKAARSFLDRLAQRIDAVRAETPQSKPHFLRDEMREHRRLWDAGVLSDAEYEASKRRILQAHG
jgi:hypothetical protein